MLNTPVFLIVTIAWLSQALVPRQNNTLVSGYKAVGYFVNWVSKNHIRGYLKV